MPKCYNDNEPPDRGADVFRLSQLTPRSPPAGTSRRALYNEPSPAYVTPEMKPLPVPSAINSSPLSVSDGGQPNYCELVSEASTFLSKINELVNDQGSRMNNANKTAIMDYTQRITAIVSLLALKSSCNETKLANIEREINQTQATRPLTDIKKPSYADKLKLSNVVPQVDVRSSRAPCVIAYPTAERSADYASSSATKQALLKAIKPMDDGFQIVGVKKAAKSGVVLRVTNERQIKKLESVDAIKAAGLRLEKPKSRRPRLLIKDVPISMEDNAFLVALYRQNIKDEMSLKEDDFIKATKIIRNRKLQNGRKWVGIELDPEVRVHLLNTKEKIFIDWASCRFYDDLEVVRCSNCQVHGHVAKYCTEKTPTCGHCTEGHITKSCPNKDNQDFKPKCASCKRFKKPYDHPCGASDCPTYKLKLEQLVLNTNY